jgi:hypothetical protein
MFFKDPHYVPTLRNSRLSFCSDVSRVVLSRMIIPALRVAHRLQACEKEIESPAQIFECHLDRIEARIGFLFDRASKETGRVVAVIHDLKDGLERPARLIGARSVPWGYAPREYLYGAASLSSSLLNQSTCASKTHTPPRTKYASAELPGEPASSRYRRYMKNAAEWAFAQRTALAALSTAIKF